MIKAAFASKIQGEIILKTDTLSHATKVHEPTMAIGYSLRMCARHVDSTNPARSNLVFSSKPIPEAEMSNRLIV